MKLVHDDRMAGRSTAGSDHAPSTVVTTIEPH
jgi:hypothetical protein